MRRYEKYKEDARLFIYKQIRYYNQFYKYKIGKITIRNQKTRWGSCSSKGNLNFNYKIIFLPLELADYIIIHELCHLKEFNHSKNFWTLVEKQCPNHTHLRSELTKIRWSLRYIFKLR